MKRLTTDHPDGNFETMMNYVFSNDGWACVRHDGDRENVPLHEWFKRQCLARGCDELASSSPEEIDEALCDCVMWPSEDDGRFCPVALAYTFACQACHLRDRLKLYEDTGLMPEEIEEMARLVLQPNEPLTLDELKWMN